MTTISGISSPNISAYKTPATGAGGSASAQANAAGATQPAVSQSAVDSVLATLGNNASSPLTYNAAGLLGSRQPVPSPAAGATKTSMQAAKDAVVAAENVVTDTLNSLLSNSPADQSVSSSSDVSALFGLPATSNAGKPLLSSSVSTASTNSAAQNAVITAQNVVTSTLASLGAVSSPNSSGSGA